MISQPNENQKGEDSMQLHLGHRAIIALTGLAIGVRVLIPVRVPSRFGPEVDVAATFLQVLGILLLSSSLFFIMPIAWTRNATRKLTIAGVILAWLLTMLAFVLGISRTGFALSLQRTNWPLTTVGVVVFILLASTTWVLVRRSNPRIWLRVLTLALLVVLAGVSLSVAQQLHLRRLSQQQGKIVGEGPYSRNLSAWQLLLAIRAAYPEYNDLDDATLARKIIARYPRCRQALDEVAVRSPAGAKTIVSTTERFVLLPDCLSE